MRKIVARLGLVPLTNLETTEYDYRGGESKIKKLMDKMQNGWPDDLPPIFAISGGGRKLSLQNGHHRLLAAERLGFKSVPVLEITSDDFMELIDSGECEGRLDVEEYVLAHAKIVGSNPPCRPLLGGLFAEARKYDNFHDFEMAFLGQLKHGLYWHVTADPKFFIDQQKGPRDMSSMAEGQMDPGKLMITSHLDYWVAEYGKGRPYAALIDMSDVPKEAYWQVERGFGNEFWVDDPANARVVDVMPIAKAKRLDRRYSAALPDSSEELEAIFDAAHGEAGDA